MFEPNPNKNIELYRSPICAGVVKAGCIITHSKAMSSYAIRGLKPWGMGLGRLEATA